LHVGSLLDDIEGLLNDGRLLKISNVIGRDTFLVSKVFKHSLILFLSHLFGLDLTDPAVVDAAVGLHVPRTKLTVTLIRDMALVEVCKKLSINNMVTSLNRFVSICGVDIVDRSHNDLISLTVCSLLRVKG
jgi:hypothetical protein